MQIAPGKRSTPAHTHSGEEEVFYVLAGAGLSWQGGATYEVAAGDCLVHLIEGPAHTLIAGPDGLDVLAFSERTASEACFLPRAKVSWLGSSWVTAGDTPHPFAQEAAAGDLELPAEPSARPATIVNIADVPRTDGRARRAAPLRAASVSEAAGAQRTALRSSSCRRASWARRRTATAARGALRRARGRRRVPRGGAGRDRLGPGGAPGQGRRRRRAASPATGAAHAFRAGPGGLTLPRLRQSRPPRHRSGTRARRRSRSPASA